MCPLDRCMCNGVEFQKNYYYYFFVHSMCVLDRESSVCVMVHGVGIPPFF